MVGSLRGGQKEPPYWDQIRLDKPPSAEFWRSNLLKLAGEAPEEERRFRKAESASSTLVTGSMDHLPFKGHMCKPSALAGQSAHEARKGTVVECPCGKRWQVTKNHLHGSRGDLCGCGWVRL